MRCPTVKICSDDGYAVINESDFDKEKHKLYQEAKQSSKKKSKKAK